MKVNKNQTAIDVSFDLCGSLAGYPTLLSQLPVGTRVGFDDMPTFDDVPDIGQTWTPELEDVEIDVSLRVYNASALSKAPYGTDLIGLQSAIEWGEAILPTLFDYTGYIHYEPYPDVVREESKYMVNTNQTAIDVALDLSGSITALYELFEQLPVGQRIGFDDMPDIWEDVTPLGQTWTPDIQNQSFKLTLPMYNNAAVQKRRYGTDIPNLANSIAWGNDFLHSIFNVTDYLVDDSEVFLTDDSDNSLTT